MLAWLTAAWPAIAHYGFAGALIAAAVAVYVLVPINIARQAAIAVGAGALLWIVGYAAGDRDGRAVKQAEWDAANKAAIEQATRDRKDADQSIPPLTPQDLADDRARTPIGKPCGVYDANDRDCHQGSALRGIRAGAHL